jgi:hypothetical protein
MTGPHFETESPETRPISVAELLARNGTIGAPAVTRRRRRRRGDSDAVTVAELTGEIPVIRDDYHDDEEIEQPLPAAPANESNGGVQVAEPGPDQVAEHVEVHAEPVYWSEPEPRWPKSPPRTERRSGPERSAYPRPLRHSDASDTHQVDDQTSRPKPQSDAEGMSPDPVDQYTDISVDVMDSEVREAEPAAEDSAYVRSYLQAAEGTLFGGQTFADELARRRGDEQAKASAESLAAGLAADDEELGGVPVDFQANRTGPAEDTRPAPGRFDAAWRGSLIVLQSILAVAFGAGLFVAFDQLWRWNSIVALVLSVLVILGLVVGVRVVRKTEDIASTLIAVAVGALITLGPLALSLQSG